MRSVCSHSDVTSSFGIFFVCVGGVGVCGGGMGKGSVETLAGNIYGVYRLMLPSYAR